MNIKKIILLIVLVFTICGGAALLVFRGKQQEELDVVAVNDIVQTLAGQWGAIDHEQLFGLPYRLDYVVLDLEGNVVAATGRDLNEDIGAAIRNRDTMVDILKDGQILGKLIIYNNADEEWRAYRKKLMIFIFGILASVAVICTIYVLFLFRIIIRPFRKLKDFARNVAEGKLDLPLEMDRGNLFGAFTESFDIMREELNKARENERLANQSKKELVASLSHDIKTPVASIKAVSEVMYARAAEEAVRSQLEVINSKADQINTLITNMFTATLEELQELKVTVTEQSSLILYDLISKADVNQQATILGISECLVMADELRLAQVIDNIISNSYKYAGTSIDVTSRIRGSYLEVDFKDYGLGVSEEEKPLLFNKYYRAKNSGGKSGAGLGLYISKYLMNKMSGEIECVDTEEGFGIRIRLLLA